MKKNFVPLIVVIIFIVLAAYFVGFYKYKTKDKDSELNYNIREGSVLLAPGSCGKTQTECKDSEGTIYDCCNVDEMCEEKTIGKIKIARCIDKDRACYIGEYLCGNEICCLEGEQDCVFSWLGVPTCTPAHCAEDESACRNNDGTIVCCIKDGSGDFCVNRGKKNAFCYARCDDSSSLYRCGNYGGQEVCCSKNEICVPYGGKGNSPICLPINPPKPNQPGGGVLA